VHSNSGKWNQGFLKDGIAEVFLSIPWVVTMLFWSVMTCLPTVANMTTCTRWTVHPSFGNITNHISAYFYVARFNLSLQRWWYLFDILNAACSLCLNYLWWLSLTNDSYHVEGVHNIWFVETRSFSCLELFTRRVRVKHHRDYDVSHLRSDFSKRSLLLYLLLLWYIDKS